MNTAHPSVPRWLPGSILATCCLFALIGRGTGETFSVFLLPLQQAFGWDRAQLTAIYGVSALSIGLAGPIAGYLADHIGPRWLYAAGAASLVTAYLGATYATQLWQFYVTLGICTGFAATCLGNVAQTPLIAIWFRGRVGTVLGIIGGATGIGALIFAPLVQVLIDTYGFRTGFAALAGIAFLLVIPLSVLPWSRIAAGRDGFAEYGTARTRFDLRQAITEPVLWAMFGVYFLTSTAISVIQPQMVAYLVDVGFAPLTAATSVGFAGLSASVGMVLFGWLADRIGRRLTLSLSYLSTAVGLGVLMLMSRWPSHWLLVPYVCTFGLSLGSRGPLIASLAQRLYAGSALGRVLGFLLIGMGTGTAFGSWIGGELHDHFGGYQVNFAVAWASIAFALAPWWLSSDLRRL